MGDAAPFAGRSPGPLDAVQERAFHGLGHFPCGPVWRVVARLDNRALTSGPDHSAASTPITPMAIRAPELPVG